MYLFVILPFEFALGALLYIGYRWRYVQPQRVRIYSRHIDRK